MTHRTSAKVSAKDLIDQARRNNDKHDAIDRKYGFAPPNVGPADITVRTILGALWAALQTKDWNIVAEAYEITVDLHRGMTGKTYDPGREP